MRMTKSERVADIAKRCNLSEDMVNAVLNAERDSMMESLKHGQRVTLAGRVTVDPVIRRKMEYNSNGEMVCTPYVAASAKPLGSVLDELAKAKEFNVDESYIDEQNEINKLMKDNHIAVMQLTSLE